MTPGIAPDKVSEAGGSFQGAVRRMFDDIAPRYDAFNRWASLGLDERWRRAAIRRLRVQPGERVLDIATGTGDLAFACERAEGRVTGCDFAEEMIRIAADKARRRVAAASFQVASAEALPYRDAAFAGAVSAFAMRNVRPILRPVLEECVRVLRPGARCVILEFTEPVFAPVRWGHHFYTRVVVPRIGGWLAGDREPFEYLNRSIDGWYRPDEFAEVMRAAGFANVDYRRLSLGTVALHWGERPR